MTCVQLVSRALRFPCTRSELVALQPSFKIGQRLDSRPFTTAVSSRNVEEDGVHSSIARADVVHRIHVADVEAFGGIGLHLTHSRRENGWMRLFMPHISRVCDAG